MRTPVKASPTPTTSPTRPAMRFPTNPKLADYHSRWGDVCTSWRSDNSASRLVDFCDFAADSRRYRVAFKQYPLG